MATVQTVLGPIDAAALGATMSLPKTDVLSRRRKEMLDTIAMTMAGRIAEEIVSGGSVNDFSGVVFPGKLNDCSTCHTGTSYQLAGVWAAPVANGILGSTIGTGASAGDAADNLRITPTAAVCSSCHDSVVAKIHMQDAFNAANFSATQATINAATPEACTFCHGAGRVLDVTVVHSVK